MLSGGEWCYTLPIERSFQYDFGGPCQPGPVMLFTKTLFPLLVFFGGFSSIREFSLNHNHPFYWLAFLSFSV